MIVTLFIVAVLSLLLFVAGCARRVLQYYRMPLHLRWEIYPVPHEPPQRAAYGGSYFEETDWWTKARTKNRGGELRFMLKEIFAFDSVREHNPGLWWRSLLFHLGLYCLVAFVVLELKIYFFGQLLHQLLILEPTAVLIGRAGLVFVATGTLALLWRRVTDPNLRDYTHIADYLHLSFISLTSLVLLAGSLPSSPSCQVILRGLFSQDTQVRIPVLLAVGLLLAFAVLAYVPYSHMAHFIAKYFTFHAVRWDDATNVGDALREPMSRNLAYRPTWWAAHVGADGSRSWADIVMADPTREDRQ